jgi:hypothetical protein
LPGIGPFTHWFPVVVGDGVGIATAIIVNGKEAVTDGWQFWLKQALNT